MMIQRKKIMMIALIVQMVGAGIEVRACLTTFINDQNSKVFIYNVDDGAIVEVCGHEKRRFGMADRHAHFVVYTKRTKEGFLTPLYTCQQNGCGNNGNIKLKMSDIENDTSVARFFTIIKHPPHSSMVQQLPMMKKKECGACSQE